MQCSSWFLLHLVPYFTYMYRKCTTQQQSTYKFWQLVFKQWLLYTSCSCEYTKLSSLRWSWDGCRWALYWRLSIYFTSFRYPCFNTVVLYCFSITCFVTKLVANSFFNAIHCNVFSRSEYRSGEDQHMHIHKHYSFYHYSELTNAMNKTLYTNRTQCLFWCTIPVHMNCNHAFSKN